MNGLKALNDKIPNTNETIINTDSLFSKYNFTHYLMLILYVVQLTPFQVH